MAADPPLPTPGPEDAGDKPRRPDKEPKSGSGFGGVTTYVYDARPPSADFPLRARQGEAAVRSDLADGRVERFRDNPARQLKVAPDRKTGELRPVVDNGEPVYVYLCREERESC